MKPGEFRDLTPEEVKKVLEKASEPADTKAIARKTGAQRRYKIK